LNNFYTLDDLGCKIGCRGVDSLVCCDDKKVFAASSLCPSDQIVLLINNDSFCASSSSYAKLCTKGQYNSPMAFVHEIGHSFGGLGDEYDYSQYANFEKIKDYNFPNCASDCATWPGSIEAGCFGGCGYSQFFRSTEKDSIMYGYATVFNPLCQYYLNKNLDHYDAIIASNLPAPSELKYILELNYSNGKFTREKTYVVPGKGPDRNNLNSGYNVSLKDFNGNIIYSSYFNIGEIVQPFFSPIAVDRPSAFIESNLYYSLILPYSPSGRSVEIYKNNVLLTSLDVSYLSNRCGNGICESIEDHLSCSKDCSANADKICTSLQDNVCDKNCSFFVDFDCYKPLIVSLFVLILIVLGFVVYFFRRRNILAKQSL
jgi:hypothetical protein